MAVSPDARLAGREELERRKLAAELREIESRVAEKGRFFRPESFKVWVGLGIAVVTLASGILGGWTTLRQWRREYELELSQELIQLVRDLNSGDPEKSETGALLLSSFEEDALPFLVAALPRVSDPEPVIESLRLVAEKKRVDPAMVVRRLTEATDAAFREQYLHSADKRVDGLKNYFAAIGALGALSSSAAVTYLEGFLTTFERQEPPPDLAQIRLIRGWVDAACSEIQDAPCSS
ncbi:MAG: hypothetical protein R3325_13960 [Thermoanaerobaculia bacterium]|nr:hypothetical protein [Thermoanaerobaculia bacterium]